jgi:ABC-type glycerol-3-phosphate transport system permease component
LSRKTIGHRARKRLWKSLAWAIAGAALVVTVFPIYWLFSISTKTQREAFSFPPTFIYRPLFEAYVEVWRAAGFGSAFANSVKVVAMGVGLSLLIGVPAAYAVSRFHSRVHKYVLVWLLLAYMLPEFLFVIPMYVLFQQLRLYDTTVGLALMYQVLGLPMAIWLLKSFFDSVPREMGEAAEIDGASRLQALTKVYLPLIRPGLAATAILVGVFMWNELTIALSLTFDRAKTVTVAVAGFRGYAAIEWDLMTAASIIAMVPMLIFAGFVQKHIVKGLTFGGVKS